MDKYSPLVKAWQTGYMSGMAQKPYIKPRFTGEYGKLMTQAYQDGYDFAPKMLAYEQQLRDRGAAR